MLSRRLTSALRATILGPFRLLLVHRATIDAFVRRDIHGRYVASIMGLSWAVIQPLCLLVIYTFVFAYVLKLRFGAGGTTATFALYLLCGMLPWLAFADGVSRSSSVVIEHTHLIKKVVFPSEILPAYVVLSALVTEMVGLGVLLAVVTVFHAGLWWPVLLLPVIVVLQVLFTMGLSWLLASLNVFLRDIGQVLGLVMTLWLFLTPVFYPAELMPPRFRWVLDLNPMYYVVQAYRDLILDQRLPDLLPLGVLSVMALTAFVLGHWFFCRSKNAFVDVL